LRVGELVGIQAPQQRRRANQVPDPDTGARGDPLDHWIGFGMHR
jgi:hypothetical protein